MKNGALYTIGRVLIYVFLISATLLMLLPFVWMLSSSLKIQRDVFTYPIQWIPASFEWNNYVEIWQKIPLIVFFRNTFQLAIVITLIQLFTSSFAAYAFAKLRFPGRDVLFLAYVGTIAIPWHSYMVPQYIMLSRFGLTNTHTAIILLQSFTAFGVFLIRQFYMSIPDELCEAARIDGLSEYGIYARIMLPLSKPAMATLAIFTFVTVWNDFLGPRIYLLSQHLRTIQLGIRLFINQHSSDFQLVMAASLISLIPVFILFVSLQRLFVQGVATSGLKG
ncbi:MAG: carbohydrate ABC transporter permease [Oscillospiraceae bacterium]|nr:carbohydrate ABC transporter permease [Oscillospiraceae bacterium]